MQDGLTEQLRTFYETYRREMFLYALSITGCRPSAEDAVHNAFGTVLRKGRAPRELRPFMFRCVRNAALDERRFVAREAQKTSLFAKLHDETAPEARCLEAEVEEILELLSNDERECVLLKIYGGLTFKEIAQVRGVPQGTAASWYWRGLARVRAHLEAHT